MLNDRLKAAQRIADELFPAESEIEAAISRMSRLIAAIVEGRSGTRVPITIGQESLVALTQAMDGLVVARGKLAEAHAALAEDRIGVGLRAYGMGDVSNCPPIAGHLKVVGEERPAA